MAITSGPRGMRLKAIAGAMAIAIVSAIGLAACGGGGGDPPRVSVPTGTRTAVASAGADLSASNFADLSAPMIRAMVGGNASDLVPLAASREQAAAARGAASKAWSPVRVEQMARVAIERVVMREHVAGASNAQDFPCDVSGTFTLSVIDADGDNDLSRGDSIAISAANCVMDPDLPAVNGGFTMTINVVETSGDTLIGLDVTASFNNFGAVGYSVANGEFRMWSRATSTSAALRLSYRGTQMQQMDQGASVTVVYDFDILTQTSGGVTSTQVSGGMGIGGFTFVLTTPTPLVGGPPPSSGSLQLQDAQGDFVRLVARDADTFDLAFYEASNPGVPALTLTGLLWSDYDG